MIDRYCQSPLCDRLRYHPRERRRPRFDVPRAIDGQRLSRRSLGLLVACLVALAVNLIAALAFGAPLPTLRTAPAAFNDVILPADAILGDPAPAPRATTAVAIAAPTVAPMAVLAPRPVRSQPTQMSWQRPIELWPVRSERAFLQRLVRPATCNAIADQMERRAAREVARVISVSVKPRQTLAGTLQANGLGRSDVNAVIGALKGKLDFRRVRPGDAVSIQLNAKGVPLRVEYRTQWTQAPGELFVARRGEERWISERRVLPFETRRALVSGRIESTLYGSMLEAGETPTLIDSFADVFGWEIDFHREVQTGDKFKALVEKRYADGRFVGYGRILAAEYDAQGNVYRGFLFESGESGGYFNEKGQSLQKSFLRAPVAVSHITSRYGMRKHPILKTHRMHAGIDYAAPKGTPVYTVADGTVVVRGYHGAIGNMVAVRHPNGYETIYGHLSRYAAPRVGTKVRQKEVIGYCGSTGMSTGPHVHFAMKKNGKLVNPMRQEFPRGKPVPEAQRKAFDALVRLLAVELDRVEVALLGALAGGLQDT
ncbi:MAG: M23 family metallopeptidase [Deltaproteobacteria bacterium]|nr:M23 family metallopeptidase [Deltaproteobacteria bacterium]